MRKATKHRLKGSILILAAVGVVAATARIPVWIAYKAETDRLRPIERTLVERRMANADNLPVMRQVWREREKNMQRQLKNEPQTESIAVGSVEGGQYIWVKLRNLLVDLKLPAREPYLDPAGFWGIGTGLRELAQKDPKAERALREYLQFVNGPWVASLDEKTARATLQRHLGEEIRIEQGVDELKRQLEGTNARLRRIGRWSQIAAYVEGAVFGLMFGCWELIQKGVLAWRRKKKEPALKEERPAADPPSPTPKERRAARSSAPGREPEPGTTETNGALTTTGRMRKGEHRDRKELLEHAGAILAGLLSSEQWALIQRTLNGQLSNRVLLDVIDGSLESLTEAIVKNKPAFRDRYLEICEAMEIEAETGKARGNGEVANGTAAATNGRRREREHPLHRFKSGGYTGSTFHQLLSEWGFETESTGGGHMALYYRETGEPIRYRADHEEGRPVIVIGRTSKRMSQRMVRHVLNACADFLLGNEGN